MAEVQIAVAHAVSPLTIGEDRVMVRCNYGKDVYKHIHTDRARREETECNRLKGVSPSSCSSQQQQHFHQL